MGVINKWMNYLGLKEDDEDDHAAEFQNDEKNLRPQGQQQFQEEAETNAFESRMKNRTNIVPIHSSKNSRVVLYEPRSFDDAQELADHLRSRRAVVVNMQRVRTDVAIRIVDFLSGTVYALNGSISKLGPSIYLCTPDSMEIQGTISELMNEG
jgi:cell division inhibitor SepF